MSTERPTQADVEAWRGNVQESRKPVNWGDYVDLANSYLALLIEYKQQRELIVRADSYLSLLWHRYTDPNRKDADLSYNVPRTISDLREAAKSLPLPPKE